MSFFLYLKQRNEGCDYTIGCGQKLVPLAVEDLPNAEIKAKNYLEEYLRRVRS